MAHVIEENLFQNARLTKKFWIELSVLAAIIIFCYARLIATLIATWWNNSVYSHGFLIPFISLYIVWGLRHRLEAASSSPRLVLGAAVLVAGVSMLIAGHAGGVQILQEASLLVTITGVVLLTLGTQFYRVLFFPIIYLSFMFTTWGTLTERLHMPFQNFSALIATTILKALSIPVFRSGVFIELPYVTLEVAKVCSGVNYLIAVVAISIPVAYMTLKSWPRRIIMVSSALAIAILANGFRVGLIGTLAYYHIEGDLHGPYHMLQAMFVSVIGFIVIFVGAWILSRGPSRGAACKPGLAPPTLPRTNNEGIHERIKYPLIGALSLLLIAGSYINFYTPAAQPLKLGFEYFPYRIEVWKGFESDPVYKGFSTMGVDDELSRTYTDQAGRKIMLYIGYFASQVQGKELINYKTEGLHDGAAETPLKLGDGRTAEVNSILSKSDGTAYRTIFWYDLNGVIARDKITAKAYTTYQWLTENRSNGTVVMISAAEGNGVDGGKSAEAFAEEIIPILKKHLP